MSAKDATLPDEKAAVSQLPELCNPKARSELGTALRMPACRMAETRVRLTCQVVAIRCSKDLGTDRSRGEKPFGGRGSSGAVTALYPHKSTLSSSHRSLVRYTGKRFPASSAGTPETRAAVVR